MRKAHSQDDAEQRRLYLIWIGLTRIEWAVVKLGLEQMICQSKPRSRELAAAEHVKGLLAGAGMQDRNLTIHG